MVDATFFFMLLFGGALVGLVTAIVRRHGRWRAALDILVGFVSGPLGTWLWVKVAHVLFTRVPGEEQLSLSTALALADIYYFSPVIGGLLGVGAVALLCRWAPGTPRRETWGEKLGALLVIAGAVYAAIAAALTVAVLALAWRYAVELPPAGPLLADLANGPLVMFMGWALARASRRPA